VAQILRKHRISLKNNVGNDLQIRDADMVTFDAIKYKEIEKAVYSRTAESYSKYGG